MNKAHANLKDKTTRLALKIKPNAHCETIAPKRSLGYLRRRGEAGSWQVIQEIGRHPSGAPKRLTKVLGAADDLVPANGQDVLDYETARKEAARWNAVAEQAVKNAYTIDKAVEDYANYAGDEGTKVKRNRDKDAAQLRLHVLGLDADKQIIEGLANLRGIAVNAVTKKQLKDWRDDLAKRRKRLSVLRVWTGLHSALERAAEIEENNVTKHPWRDLPTIKQVSKDDPKRVRFTRPQALQILANAYAIDPAGATYFEGLYHTGARPSAELWQLTVADYNVADEFITLRGCSEDTIAKTGTRRIDLDDDGVAFFNKLVAGRPLNAPLFAKEDGDSWLVGHHSRRFSSLLEKAEAPKGAVPYSFRHTYISQNLIEGIATSLVAKQCGTSIWMIEQNYFDCLPSEMKKALRGKKRPQLTLVVNNDEAVAA